MALPMPRNSGRTVSRKFFPLSTILLSTILVAATVPPALAAPPGPCRTYDAIADWSEESNPAGAWSYLEGANPLPHIEWLQRMLGGWAKPQPGWGRSEDGNNRTPVFFISNGSENFAPDYLAGDLVVHTTDNFSGSGNGIAQLVWTSPFEGSVAVGGVVWMVRDIGRANDWRLFLNDTELTHGSLSSGDQYSRAAPFDFATGSAGAGALEDIAVQPDDEIRLVLARASDAGDFVGVRMTVECSTIVTTTTTTTLPPRDCGDPVGDSLPPVTAADALYVLKCAVGQFTCEKCLCDADGSDSIGAVDALIVLKYAVGQEVLLKCPAC